MKGIMKSISVALLSMFFLVIIFTPKVMAVEPIAVGELDGQPAGTYPVEIFYIDEATGQQATRIVYMTVLYPNTVVGDAEAIDAMDVLLDAGEVEQLSNDELIARAKAHAWNIADGTPVPITQISIENTGGQVYNITFATSNGTRNTVTFIASEGTMVLNQNEVYIAPIDTISETTVAWVYLSILAFVFFPIIIMVIVFLWMMVQVKRTRNLLYNEYQKK